MGRGIKLPGNSWRTPMPIVPTENKGMVILYVKEKWQKEEMNDGSRREVKKMDPVTEFIWFQMLFRREIQKKKGQIYGD